MALQNNEGIGGPGSVCVHAYVCMRTYGNLDFMWQERGSHSGGGNPDGPEPRDEAETEDQERCNSDRTGDGARPEQIPLFLFAIPVLCLDPNL